MCFLDLCMVIPGGAIARIAKTATGKACNECKTTGRLGMDCG